MTPHRFVFLTLILVTSAGLMVGCQTKPTQVYETKENHQKQGQEKISEKVILIDARPPFQYAMSHPNGSISLQWEDFNQKEPPFEGYLVNDLFFEARRLARLGIGPESEILILGRGPAGEGEEGRLAWTFRRMGLKNVRFAGLSSIRWPSTQAEAPPKPEVPIWKPSVDDSLQADRKPTLEQLKKNPQGSWVLDVRSGAEYLKDGDVFAKLRLHARVINVPWTEFLNSQGELNPAVQEKLTAVGIHHDDEIFVLDEKGVRSAGATLRLRELGYSKARNWTGGYREIRHFLRKR